MPNPNRIPASAWLIAMLVVAAQAGSILLWMGGRLHGPQRNLIPQTLLGGAVILIGLAGYLLSSRAAQLRPVPGRSALAIAVLILLVFTAIYISYVRPIITLPYDLASWSEGYFVNDMNKWHSGARLYVAPEDSNSSVYTFLAPMTTYLIASLLRHPTSIPLYRLIEQAYLVVAAFFCALATWNLVKLALPERIAKLSRLWIVFFFLGSFLLATNRWTNAFNVFLHTDAMAILATTVAFWLMTKHAISQDSRWLVAMAVMPSVAFLTKQYLGIWSAVYVLYLLVGSGSIRRAALFAMAALAILGVSLAACLTLWGSDFRYWVLFVMSRQVVSFVKMFNLFAVGAWCTLLGLIGGAILLRGRNLQRLLGMWLGWVVMVLAANYTAGIAYIPTHLGPATMVGGAFFLAALASIWPTDNDVELDHVRDWLRAGNFVLVVLVVFGGLGYPLTKDSSTTPDFYRYVHDIEREFDGEAPSRVLIDFGDWVYLRDGVIPKDRAAILPVHMEPHFGMIDRLNAKDYARILVRNLHRPEFFVYDQQDRTGIRKALLQNYREVRVIPGVRGMKEWLYYEMMLSDVSVLEPINHDTPRGRLASSLSQVRAAVQSTSTSSR